MSETRDMLLQHTIALVFSPQSRDLQAYRLSQFTCTSQIRTVIYLYHTQVLGTFQVSIAHSHQCMDPSKFVILSFSWEPPSERQPLYQRHGDSSGASQSWRIHSPTFRTVVTVDPIHTR
jgi:hypothetical protein